MKNCRAARGMVITLAPPRKIMLLELAMRPVSVPGMIQLDLSRPSSSYVNE